MEVMYSSAWEFHDLICKIAAVMATGGGVKLPTHVFSSEDLIKTLHIDTCPTATQISTSTSCFLFVSQDDCLFP